MLVHDLIKNAAQSWPEQAALICDSKAHSFASIDRSSDRLASELRHRGISRGDRVVLMLENSVEFVVALWAVLKAGAVVVPIAPSTRSEKLAFILDDSGARGLFTHAHFRPSIAAAAAHRAAPPLVISVESPGFGQPWSDEIAAVADTLASDDVIDVDLAFIIYTSGSTGRPKGVMMLHRTVCNNVSSIAQYLESTLRDLVICALPLSFSYGLFQVLTAALVGSTVVLERSFAFPYDVLQHIQNYRVTGLPGVPTMFARLLEFAPFREFNLSSLRYVTNAGAALPTIHIQQLREFFPHVKVFSMYGLTECTRATYLDPMRLSAKPNSVGRAIPNSEVYPVDESGRRVPSGEVGELVVRGSNVMLGYWRRPEETARVLRDGELPGQKVLHTGDLFRMDDDGDLYFIGRIDDVFKCRGAKVSPIEIENVLYELDGIAEAAIVGVPNGSIGMAIKAIIVPVPGHRLTEQLVRQHCRSRLEPWLLPTFIEICSALPKTDSGKITRRALRQG